METILLYDKCACGKDTMIGYIIRTAFSEIRENRATRCGSCASEARQAESIKLRDKKK